jgi:hypothetical protein
MSKKPYSWDEIKKFLIGELKKTKHIMTFGTIGSCNVEHDVDLIITKKPRSSLKDFFKEIHNLFEDIDNYLNKKYNAHAIRFSTSEEEFSLLALMKDSKRNLAFHGHIYITYPEMERDWNWALFESDNFKKILKVNYDCLIGSVEDLFDKEFQKKSYYDPIFIFLYKYDKINSHYPEKILLKAMHSYFDYLYRKRLGLKTPPMAKNRKEIKDIFYQLCDKIDDLRKIKP